MASARTGGKGRLLVALSAAALVGLLAVAPVHADTQGKLSSAEARVRALIGRIAKEEKTVRSLEGQAAVLAQAVDKVQTNLSLTQGRIIDLETQVRDASTALSSTQVTLDRRAWVAYEIGPGSNLDFLLGSTSLADLTDRLEIVNHVAQSDADLIVQISDGKTLLQSRQGSLQQLQTGLQAQMAELSVKEDALNQKLDSAQAIVDQLNRDKAAAQRHVRALQAQARREFLAALGAAIQGGGSGPSIPGVLLVCPVDQPHAYSDDFGAPRQGPPPHPHAGNDIVAPMGTPIRAPFDGLAVDASGGLGGQAVVVYGALGHVYNAHLSAFGTLGQVKTGTIIGYVGNTGDAQGGVMHDHFEWHPNVIPPNPWKSPYGYRVVNGAIDPFPYLNSVC